jgi:lisH domain-containing protein FOPNL
MSSTEPEAETLSDLSEVVKEALSRRGVLNKVRATIRAEIFHALEDKTVTLPDKPREVFLASELIREFLQSSSLNSTLSVYNDENGQPADMTVDREFIGGELGVNVQDSFAGTSNVPLLVLLVKHLLDQKEDLENALHQSLYNNRPDDLDDA